MTRTNFDLAVEKGTLGELLVQDFFEKKGFVVYRPVTPNKAHLFDMLIIKGKTEVFAVDAKTKAHMSRAKETGINQDHFEQYMHFQKTHNIPFILMFVDEHLEEMYGAPIDDLEKNIEVGGIKYPYTEKNRDGVIERFWPVFVMEKVYREKIKNPEILKILRDTSQRNFGYP